MMNAMGGHPEDGSALERQRAAESEEVLDELGRLVSAVREQPVIAHADAKHPAHVVKNESGEYRAGVDVEEGRHGADVKAGHGDCGYPVQAGLMFTAV